MLKLALQCWLCELRQEAPTLSQVEKARNVSTTLIHLFLVFRLGAQPYGWVD